MKLAVLNGCESLAIGLRLRDEAGVEFVVCWETAADDVASRVFATGFWLAMPSGSPTIETVTIAFEAGRDAVVGAQQRGRHDGSTASVPRFALKDPAGHPPDGQLADGRWAAGLPVLLAGGECFRGGGVSQRDVVTELKFDKESYTAEALAEAIRAHGPTLRKLDLG